jgi:hypothetical protein
MFVSKTFEKFTIYNCINIIVAHKSSAQNSTPFERYDESYFRISQTELSFEVKRGVVSRPVSAVVTTASTMLCLVSFKNITEGHVMFG